MNDTWKDDWDGTLTQLRAPDDFIPKNGDTIEIQKWKWKRYQSFYVDNPPRIFDKYALIARVGSTEYNLKRFYSKDVLFKLEHGRTYDWADIGSKAKGKFQFIVEDLTSR